MIARNSYVSLRHPFGLREMIMVRFFQIFLLSVALVAWSIPSSAQASITQALQPAAPAAAANNTNDPLGRNTPSNSILGFLKAAQSGDYSIAAQYLQMSAARRQSEGEQLAEKLNYVLNRAFTGSPREWSTLPEGTPQEGIPLGRQKLGTISSGDVEADLEVVRLSD